MLNLKSLYSNVLFKNSFWGLTSHISQAVLTSLFFIIVTRKYSVEEFSDYTISISFYQLVASFSSLGLGQWFIREITDTFDQKELVNKFIKIEICSGLLFWIFNGLAAFLIYDHRVGLLTIILGANIVLDNAIYGIKNLNIAQFQQIKTFIILTIEAFLKFIAGCILLYYPVSLIGLTFILVALRFVTLNLFIKIGSSSLVTMKSIMKCRVRTADLTTLIAKNWSFIVIGSASITYWRIANIIISKKLAAIDVANYEISYKIFSLAQILPVVVSASTFPVLAKLFATGKREEFGIFYRQIYTFYFVFGLISFIFMHSFANTIIPLVFGSVYSATAMFTKEMFFTILIFPTAYLQANALVAMKLERYDMWLNVVSLVCNIVISMSTLAFVRSLSVINWAIFASFLVFHVLQNMILVKHKICTLGQAFSFYFSTLAIVLGYSALTSAFHDLNALFLFSGFTFCCLLWIYFDSSRSNQTAQSP